MAVALVVWLRHIRRKPSPICDTDAQGRFTEADEIVGEVSAGGSLFLIVGVGPGAAMSLATLVLFGATFGVLVDQLAQRWPRAVGQILAL